MKKKAYILIFLFLAIGLQAAITPQISSFNTGQVGPLMVSRKDFAKYDSACKTLQNMLVTTQGPVERRPGTKYIASVKTHTDTVNMETFEFAKDDTYGIEMGDQYFRFYRNGGQVLESQGTASLTTLDNIVAHYLLDDNDADVTVLDDDGNTHQGTTTVGTEDISVIGKVDRAFNLQASWTVSIPDHTDFSFTNNATDTAFSLVCWAYVDGQEVLQTLLSKWQDEALTQEWRLSLSSEQKLQLHLSDSGFDLTSALIAQWYLNDDAANTTVLEVSNTHTGTASANTSVLSTAGKINDCFDFDGQYSVEIADATALSFGNAATDTTFSIATWINVTNAGPQDILTKYDATTGSQLREWRFFLASNEALFLDLYDESANAYIRQFMDSPLALGWNYVVGTAFLNDYGEEKQIRVQRSLKKNILTTSIIRQGLNLYRI